MKSMKRAILIILVLNLLAMLGGIGWLAATGRLSRERVLEMTELFDEPVSVEAARLEAEKKAEAERKASEPKPLPDTALNSDERNLVRVEMTRVDMARLERMKREVQSLQEILRQERAELERERRKFEDEREDFKAMRDRLAGLEGGRQFKKALSTLTGMKPRDAKAVLSTMLKEGGKYEEVVSYLSAMGEEERAAIMSEFVKAGEEHLAGDLLESVRLRGLETMKADGATP